jgi:SAM-dependent methyltransferase
MNHLLHHLLVKASTTLSDGVWMVAPPSPFEVLYEQARAKEQRILTDAQVAVLPDGRELWNAAEWRIRTRSAQRLQKALSVTTPQRVLEVGCGNGWLSALLQRSGHEVLGIDLFTHELKQAARVFPNGPVFARCDPFEPRLPTNWFDTVVLAASLQYFGDLPLLIKRLFELLKPAGTIHVMDTVLYRNSADATEARLRTERYYAAIQVPELSAHYHAHTQHALHGSGHCQVLATPASASFLDGLMGRRDPFTHVVLSRKRIFNSRFSTG